MPAESFPDNWTYLRTELAWLDRLLSLAIARQRKDTKEIERVSRSGADRVSSHWWKGLVTLEGDTAYDSPVEMARRKPATAKTGVQQLEAKIRASQQQGIALGLPSLCDRLQLEPFEKNLVVIALAPEISRRYGRIYNYLQDPEQIGTTGLPTVDLVLRLLCRTDAEWRSARQCLTADSTLVHHQLLQLPSSAADSLLARPVKLADSLVNYLLADRPDLSTLDRLVPSSGGTPSLQSWSAPASAPSLWADLILPSSLLAALQHLCRRVQVADSVDEIWGFQATNGLQPRQAPGALVLLAGPAGTGKTTAAQAIAQSLQTSLVWVDLAQIKPGDAATVLQTILDRAPTLLLLKSAHLWLNRASPLLDAEIHQFWQGRQENGGITLLSVPHSQAVRLRWRQRLTQILEFSPPDEPNRLRLWQRFLPAQAPLDSEIDWKWLSRRSLTGGEIRTIAREAALYAAAESPPATLRMHHLVQALAAQPSLSGSRLRSPKETSPLKSEAN